MSTHDSIERRARALYRQSCQDLSADACQALRTARLDAVATRPPGIAQRFLMPASALAASALVLAVVWIYIPAQLRHDTGVRGENTSATLPSTHAEADADLYQNLDFYRWLANRTEPLPARN